MNFKYFESPEKFGCFLDEITECDICGKERKCFDACFFYGENSMEAICPECLADGKLKETDICTCEGDSAELERQLKVLHPLASAEEIVSMKMQKTAELEKTTPALVTWQDWDWPAYDGDYCAFICYGSRPFYNQMAKDNDGKTFFKNSMYYSLVETSDIDSLWDDSMPEKLVQSDKDAESLSPLFYVFRSLHSDKIITVWDID